MKTIKIAQAEFKANLWILFQWSMFFEKNKSQNKIFFLKKNNEFISRFIRYKCCRAILFVKCLPNIRTSLISVALFDYQHLAGDYINLIWEKMFSTLKSAMLIENFAWLTKTCPFAWNKNQIDSIYHN